MAGLSIGRSRRRGELLISIIIPCWNGEALVGEAIESALGQTYPHVEVIVVDDGSTDGSLGVVQSFGDRVRWATGPNRGGCAARNKGVEMARGELIQFLDADDLLFPNKIERVIDRVRVVGPGAMVVCDWETEDPRNAPAVSRLMLGYRDEDPVAFLLRHQLPTPSPLHWKENLERVDGFDEALPCSQERDLHLRLACAGVMLEYVPEVLYRTRLREGSVSSNFVRILEQHRGIFSRACETLAEGGRLTQSRREAFAGAMAKDGRLSVRFGRLDLAATYFARAEDLAPGSGVDAFRAAVLRSVARGLGPIAAERVCQLALALGVRR